MSTVTETVFDRVGRRFGYDERSAAVLVMPVFIVLLAVAVFPIVYSFYTSLFDINLTRPWRRPFIGFDNYFGSLPIRISGSRCSALRFTRS